MADEERTPIHEQFIASLPEELQEGAAPYAEHWDKYVQDQFGSRAEEQKAWEPYAAIPIDTEDPNKTVSVRDIPLSEMAELLAFREIAKDKEAFKAWYDDLGKLPDFQQQRQTPEYDDDAWVDPQVAALQQQVQELASWKSQQETQWAQQQQEQQFIEGKAWVKSETDKIKETHPALNDEDIEFICALAGQYEPGPDVVQKGFHDFQKIVNGAERNLFEKKLGQPSPPERGGVANTAAEPVRSYEDAGAAARLRVRQAMNS